MSVDPFQGCAHDGDRTVDGALGNAVTLVQLRKGYRFSLDSVLLARFAAESPVRRVLDLGCGCGVVGLCLLRLGGAKRLVGIDVQPEMVALAEESAICSELAGCSEFYCLDYRRLAERVPPSSVSLVVANPPYRPERSGRLSPQPSVALARHEVKGNIHDLTDAVARALAPRGEFCAVFPAGRLAALVAACRQAGLEPRVLRCVHPRVCAPASLVLLRCAKGGREVLEVRAPLVLHGGGGRYSAEAATLLGPP